MPSLLRERDFGLLLGAATVSNLGSQFTTVAIPLLAIRLLHADTLAVGVLSASGVAAFVLVGIPAGQWVSRFRRRPIMMAADFGRAALLAWAPIAYALHALTVSQLFIIVFLHGVLTVLFDLAAQSLLPAVVRRDQLMEGNAKLGGVDAFARTAGPNFAGILISVISAPVAIVIDAISFLSSGLVIGVMRGREAKPVLPPECHGAGREIYEGLEFVLRPGPLRATTLTSASTNFFMALSWVAVVTLVGSELNLPNWMIGLIFSAGGIGSLAGSLLARHTVNRIGVRRAIWMTLACAAPFQLAAPLIDRGAMFFVAVLAIVVVWTGIGIRNVAVVSYRQRVTPAHLLTRVTATARFITWGARPLGALAGGVLGQHTGLRPTLWIAAGFLCLGWIPPLLSNALHAIDGRPGDAHDEEAAAGRDHASQVQPENRSR